MSLYAFVCDIMRSYVFLLLPMCSYAVLDDTPKKAFSRLALGFCLPDERPYLFHLPDCGAGAEFDGLWVLACFYPVPPCRGTYAQHMQHLGQPDKAFLWHWFWCAFCVCAFGHDFREALIKWHLGNAQLFRLARRELFLKQEWTLPSMTVSKKVMQRRQTE